MPFDSRKQQQWYHATDQTYWDDKPHSYRKVKQGGSKSGEGEDPEFKDLTTTAGGDLDPQNKNLQTTQGSMKESLVFEGKEYKLSPEGHVPNDDDLEYDDKIYTEVTEEDKTIKREQLTELASEYTYKEMRESLLKNDVKQIIAKAVEEFKEDEHPREEGGKFTSGGGSSSGKSERGSVDPDIPATADDVDWTKVSDDKLAKWSQAYPKDEDIKKEYDKRDKEQERIEVGKSSKELASMFTDKPKADWNSLDELRYASVLEWRSDRLKLDDFSQRDQTTLFNRLDKLLLYGSHIETFKKIVGIDGEMGNGYALKGGKWGKLSDKDKIKLLDFSTSLSNKSREVYAKEEGLASVSGPPADSTMRIMSDKTHVRPEGKFVDEIIDENLTDDTLTDDTLTDTVLGESLEFEGENYVLSPNGYNPTNKDLIFEGKIYKAQEGVGNCEFCAGKGQVTVENLGIKDCPDCDGTGEIQQPNLAPDITGQMDPSLQPQPAQETPQQIPQPDQPTQQGQIPQQPMPNEQPAPPQQAPEENKEKPKFGEAKVSEGGVGSGRKSEGGKDDMRNWLESSGIIGPDDEVKQHHEDYYNKQMQATKEELKKKEAGEVKIIACEKSMKQYRGYIAREIEVLAKKAKANEAVSIMYGLPTISKQGKKIKGILAYAGVSLNDRIYLPEELAKGHGLTLPLLLNHSNIAGAEEELDRLDDDMVSHLEDERDFKIGEVTLEWDQEKLTLFYEGIIDHPFFQKEVDDADMAVSLGIYYDSDSPVVCDENCYTIIKGAEFREVSLVYHPGFPISTIEAVEHELKEEIMKKQKAKEDHLEKLEQLKKNEEEEQIKGEDETEDIKLVNDVIEDVKEGEENEEDIIVTDDPETLDLVTQVPAEDWNAPIGNEVAIDGNFSVRGINGFTISNSNGVTRYKLDPSNGYENNWLHVNVNKDGAKLYGEEFQLQPKMTTPPELTKEIESHPDLKFTDSDADAFNPKKKVKAQDNFLE